MSLKIVYNRTICLQKYAGRKFVLGKPFSSPYFRNSYKVAHLINISFEIWPQTKINLIIRGGETLIENKQLHQNTKSTVHYIHVQLNVGLSYYFCFYSVFKFQINYFFFYFHVSVKFRCISPVFASFTNQISVDIIMIKINHLVISPLSRKIYNVHV